MRDGSKIFSRTFCKIGIFKGKYRSITANSIKDIRLQVYETVWGSTRDWGNKGTDSPVIRKTDRRREEYHNCWKNYNDVR